MTRTAPAPLPVTEAEWQEQVVRLASMLGWEHCHTRRSIGKGQRWTTATSKVGWPDLVLWHPKHGVWFVELKTETGVVSPAQVACLASLAAAGARTAVWRPRDLDGPVLAALQGKPTTSEEQS